jgi:hypothetical protein|uniref:Uncharacterized protein n=1 Tax=Curvibacter symbiont subsp. Hydra magnipapillata TaxID=667019 RepID=C9YBQ0_CURXX|nr:hypothetical protein Csp_A15510 [Curvibacter putative symbiont of Hydra magnipapillata]
MMPKPITFFGFVRHAMVLLALLVCAGALWAPAQAQTAPTVFAVMDRSRFAIDMEIRIQPSIVAKFLALIQQWVAQSRGGAAVVDFRAFADFGQRLKPLLAAPLTATLLRPLQ